MKFSISSSKWLFVLVSVVLISLVVFHGLTVMGADGTSSCRAPCMYVKAYGGSDSTLARCIINTSDNGFAVTGFTRSYGAGERDLLLMKFNCGGRLLWTRTLGGSNCEEGRSVVETHDGGLVVTGYTNSFAGPNIKLLLAKFNSDGDTLWVKVMKRDYVYPVGALDFWGHSVIEDSDDNLVVTGYMYYPGTPGVLPPRHDLLLAKFDAQGDLINARFMYNSNLDRLDWDHYGHSLVEMCDGRGYLVAGRLEGAEIGRDMLLAKFTRNGYLDWGWWISEPGNDNPEKANSLIRTSNCSYVLTGVSGDDLVVIKRDEDVNPVWANRLTTGLSKGRSLTETSDGGIVVTGLWMYDALLAKWDAIGNWEWSRIFGGDSGRESGLSVVENSHSYRSLLVTGYSESWGAGGKDLLLSSHGPSGWTCLPHADGPGSAEWNPLEGFYLQWTDWTPIGIEHIDWPYPTISSPTPGETCTCVCGDVNCDCSVSISDVVYLIHYLFRGGPPPCCPPPPYYCADVNCDEAVDIADVVYLIGYLFRGGAPPCCLCNGSSGYNRIGGGNEAEIGLGSPNITPDGIFEIPILTRCPSEIAGVQLELTYNPEDVELLDPVIGRSSEGLQIFSHIVSGTQKIGLADLYGMHSIARGDACVIIVRGVGKETGSVGIAKAIIVDSEARVLASIVSNDLSVTPSRSGRYTLSQNFPNPFNPETEINYTVPNACNVELCVHNVLGQKIKTLVDEYGDEGEKTVIWDGTDEDGQRVSSGIYFFKLKARDFTQTRKMVLLK